MSDENIKEQIDLDNPELQNALQIIRFTHNSLFLTGKAGTGKSTFLRYIAANTKKKRIILAPTGIAAINAGGSTLHSFFKLPFHPLLPNDSRYTARNIRETLKYNREKVKILREVELIIIDEISMVRADIIDFIDKVLRIYNHNMREPFGGKQLLLVGDVYQLEPVVKEEDRQLLAPFYDSPYFFNAKVWQEMSLVSIELKKVYRQKDSEFIGILDHIRTNKVSVADLARLNQCVSHDEPHGDGKLSITLTTRRDTVDYINSRQLDKLPGKEISLVGEITGEFPESSLPTTMELRLKPQAHVIFIKNDIERRWVNGTLGVVVDIDEDGNLLEIETDDGNVYEVERAKWSNVRYHFNDKEKKIEEEEIGTFVQFPVKLAWAITVHKSQGLTFNRVNIDFSGGVFAGGQAYVALSRCTSLEGLTLREPIRRSEVFVNDRVVDFARSYNDNSLMDKVLRQSKADRAYYDAVAAFDKGDFSSFLKSFLTAIHSRYDIEQPVVLRYIRRKLDIINQQRREIDILRSERNATEKRLRKLAVEYTVMGRECEKEGMTNAAIANYKKALELWPDAPQPNNRLKKLEKNKK